MRKDFSNQGPHFHRKVTPHRLHGEDEDRTKVPPSCHGDGFPAEPQDKLENWHIGDVQGLSE